MQGFATTHGTAVSGAEPIELVLDVAGEIAGRVLDAAGTPVTDAVLVAEAVPDTVGGARFGTSVMSDEGDGHFVLPSLAAGRYVLQARGGARGQASLSGITVTTGKRTEVGTLRLESGRTIRGTVVDPDGKSVFGARLVAKRDVMTELGDLVGESGSGGAFTLRGAVMGRYGVTASHPAFASSVPAVVDVDSDEDPESIRIVLSDGGRLVGRVQRRDGQAFADGKIRVRDLEPVAGGPPVEPLPLAPDGSFAGDHLTPGRTSVEVLGYSASGVLQGLAAREVVLRDGETARVDLQLQEVVVTGTVTRGGLPARDIRVSVQSLVGVPLTMGVTGGWQGANAIPGPPFGAAVTRDDGSFELVVCTPGRARVGLESADGRQRFAGREVEIPDADRLELNLEIGGTQVTGTVVDKESQDPLDRATVRIRRASARTSVDGRFAIAVEPGDLQLEAQAPGYERAVVPLKVTSEGLADVLVALELGGQIRGRVVDGVQSPVPFVQVVATDSAGYSADAESLADGSFQIVGLSQDGYTLVAGGESVGWSVQSGTKSGEAVTLTLRKGGLLHLRALDESRRPVRGAYPILRRIDGQPAVVPGSWASTDASGVVEINVPPGLLEFEVAGRGQTARCIVSVSPAEAVSTDVVLEGDRRLP